MLTIQKYSVNLKYSVNFKSNHEREWISPELAQRIREQEEQRRRLAEQMAAQEEEKRRIEAARRAEEERIRLEQLQKRRSEILEELKREIHIYPDTDNVMSKKMAAFLSRFTLAIQNNSEHDIREFYGDEATAKELREKLTPACQQESKELRGMIQKLDETRDPVMMLIAANKMKKFMPKEGLLNPEQQNKFLQGLKDTITMSVQNCDMSEFDDDDKFAIGEMVQKIKASETTDFGISVKLKALIDKLNKKKLNIGFIPPVQVRELKAIATIAKSKI